MPAPTGSRSIACVEGMEEGLRGRSTTEVRTGGGGVAHTLSIAGTDTEVKEVIGTPSEEKTAELERLLPGVAPVVESVVAVAV